MIIVLGVRSHPPVASICNALDALGSNYEVLDRERESIEVIISGDPAETDNITFSHDLSGVAVIINMANYDYELFGSDQAWADRYTAETNWAVTERNIMLCNEHLVVNSPYSAYRCRSKLWQLRQAKRAGFAVPDSVVTDSTRVILQRIGRSGRHIAKMLGDPHVPVVGAVVSQRAIMTNEITTDLIDTEAERDAHPLYIQELIHKDYEARIIVVGEDVFAFRVDPRRVLDGIIDYRRGGAAISFAPLDLEASLVEKLKHLHREIGLFWGCYDFIFDFMGRAVFLEVNPEGMWAGHDALVGGNIGASFARQLTSMSSR